MTDLNVTSMHYRREASRAIAAATKIDDAAEARALHARALECIRQARQWEKPHLRARAKRSRTS